MSNVKIKVGFLSREDPCDKKAWSGTIYQLYKNIQTIQNVEVLWIPIKRKIIYEKFMKIFMGILSRIFLKKKSEHLIFYSKILAKDINHHLLDDIDIVFAPSGSVNIAYLKIKKPIIYLTDSTFHLLYNYYPIFSNFFSFNVKQGNVIEKKAADNSTTIIVSSDWAKNSFINDYKIPEKKIKVIEFGANIDNIKVNPKFNFQKTGQLNLLFLGVDWERKGGEIAVECLSYLNGNNIKSILQVVGVDPPMKYKNDNNIKSYGFLNKNLDKDYNLLKEIIYNSDLLILPTKAECSAIVFSEASAYGLPILTYDTGGIPNYVINGQNGYRLNLKCGGEEFAEKILEIIHLKELNKLREGSFAIYKQKLNWECWKTKFMNVINEITESK